MGSRNGQASLAMWVALQQKDGLTGLRADCVKCFENAKFLVDLFISNGVSAMLNK